eukprot:4862786-Pleurochrysis_carterae.AAC.5
MDYPRGSSGNVESASHLQRHTLLSRLAPETCSDFVELFSHNSCVEKASFAHVVILGACKWIVLVRFQPRVAHTQCLKFLSCRARPFLHRNPHGHHRPAI